jgi:uncharacterized membrane protein
MVRYEKTSYKRKTIMSPGAKEKKKRMKKVRRTSETGSWGRRPICRV